MSKTVTDADRENYCAIFGLGDILAIEARAGLYDETSSMNAIRKARTDLQARLDKAEAENAAMRAWLIQAGRNAGALFSNQVSTAFLKHIPDEVKARIDQLTAKEGS